MIVGIDASAAIGEAVSGVGYHIIRLLEAMDRQAPADVSFRVFFPSVETIDSTRAAERLPSSLRTRLIPLPFWRTQLSTAHRAFTSVLMPAAALWSRCDVFHGPAHIVPRVPGVPSVVTIHDMAFFRHELHEKTLLAALRASVSRSLSSATSVVALSENTRKDIADIAGRTSGVDVIYGAGNYATEETRRPQPVDRQALAELGVDRRYVLYVGDFNPRKNVPYLIESFAHLKRQPGGGDVQLVLAGNSRDARATLESQARDRGLLTGDVVFAGRVSDTQLAQLYRNAAAFALCSLMEGFTLVTLEAMSYGVPVVATNTSSIAEGTGNAAELVALDDPTAVAAALRTAISPGARRDEMIRLGLERVLRFSWETAAEQTLALYRRMATAGRHH